MLVQTLEQPDLGIVSGQDTQGLQHVDERRHDVPQQPIHALRQRLHHQVVPVAVHDKRREEIGFAVHHSVRRGVDRQAAPKVGGTGNARPNQRRVGDCLAERQHPQRDLRAVAEERRAQGALAGTDHADDGAGVCVGIPDVGPVDPRVPVPEAVLAAG